MLVWVTSECMVSIININDNNIYVGVTIVVPTGFWAYYVKVRKSLHTLTIIRGNTISNHIDTRVSLPKHEGVYMVYRPERYTSKKKIPSTVCHARMV